MHEHVHIYSNWMIAIFALGYLLIIFEHIVHINKATSALIMAVGLWSLQFADGSFANINMSSFSEHLADVSQVILFLLSAVTIVEIIHAHGGFSMVANAIRVSSKKLCLLVVGALAFILSAVLDNLTTTIVFVVMLKKLLEHQEDRLIFGSVVVIAANAGGVWSPIGDVTTTMLWIGGQVSAIPLAQHLFLPSLACFLASSLWLSFSVKGQIQKKIVSRKDLIEPRGEIVFVLGILSLVFVPVFKLWTGLPPFMGILFSLSFMWLVTDMLHRKYDGRDHLKVPAILPRVDFSSVFFFLGILLSVNALETAGILHSFALWLDGAISSKAVVAIWIGLASAVIDNVPLVAGIMGMYDVTLYAKDHPFWLLMAYCAGTGGSILIIGSAAGVAFMGLEKVTFFWYLRKAGIAAAVGYFIGIAVYFFQA